MALGLVAGSSALVGASASDAGQAASDWPQFHYDLKRTGYNPTETQLGVGNVGQLSKTWGFLAGAGIGSSPSVVGSTVYFGSSDKNLYALNASTGQQIWAYPTGGIVWTTPAVAGGRVFFGSEDKNVYSVNASNGSLIWSYPAATVDESATLQSSPVVATQNRTLYIGVSTKDEYQGGQMRGRLIALNAANGTPKWTYYTVPEGQFGGGVWGPPSVDPGAGLVFFTSGNPDNAVYALDWNTGALRWKFQPPTDPELDLDFGVAPTVFTDANGKRRVAAGGKNGIMYCLDEATGTEIWEFTASPEGSGIRSSAAFDPNTKMLIFGSVGDVQVTSGHIYALNATSGAQVWKVDEPADVVASPTVANGVVYAAYGTNIQSRLGGIVALNAGTGATLWSFNDRTAVWSSPTVTKGQVWIGGINNQMYHFALP